MRAHLPPSWFSPRLIAGAAVLLIGSAGAVLTMDRMLDVPRVADAEAAIGPLAALSEPAPLDDARAPARRRCSECGVIESMREMASAGNDQPAKGARRYELTLRLADGSRQVIANAHAGTWKIGDRVIAIGPSHAPVR